MKSKLIMFLVVLFVIGGAVQAADSLAILVYNETRSEVVPDGGVLFAFDSSDNAQTYQLQISLENSVDLGGISLPFVFDSPSGDTIWSFIDAGGFNSNPATVPPFVTGITGSRWMSGVATDGSCWDGGGTQVTAYRAPTQFLIGGVGFSGVLTPGPMEHMLSASFVIIGFSNPDDPPQQLCIDTMKYGNTGDFIYSPVTGPTIAPGFSGRQCFSVTYYPLDADDANPGLSYSFELSQNRPNPFNPSTRVDYSLARKSHVNIEVFNILGQRVITLVDGEQEAGPHYVVWEGRDGTGNQVASGIYFYKMVAGDYVQTRKMALMR